MTNSRSTNRIPQTAFPICCRPAVSVFSIVLALACSLGFAGPQILSYQGSLLGGRTPVADGQYDMRFTIHTDPLADAPIWTETDADVQVTAGLFSTLLGDGSVFSDATFTNSNLWLEIAVDLSGDHAFEPDELYSPRQQLTSVPWAMKPPRQFDAIVAPSGGDYTSITAALDAGHRSIFVRNGFYRLRQSITIDTSNTAIVGESRDGVIIDCNGTHRITVAGSGSPYTAGSISVNNGGTAVAGAGTAWLANIAAGEYIQIGNGYYRIQSVVANDVLTLAEPYQGPDLAGISYLVAGFLTGVRLENLTIQNFATAANWMIGMDWVLDSSIRNCTIRDSAGVGLYLYQAHRFVARGNAFQSNRSGFSARCSNSQITESFFTNNDEEGIQLDAPSFGVLIAENHCTNNRGSGIYATPGAGDLTISGNVCGFNYAGISVVRTSSTVTIAGNTCSNNTEAGIQVYNCQDTAVSGNVCQHNGVGIWLESGSGVAVTGNTASGNSLDGVLIRGTDEAAIVGNTCRQNGRRGVLITVGDNNLVGHNILTGNTVGAGAGPASTHERATNWPAF